MLRPSLLRRCLSGLASFGPAGAAALGLALWACGGDSERPPAMRDHEVTGAPHPFWARPTSHCAGPAFDSIIPTVFRARGETLYFQGVTENGETGLWATDGTVASTRLLAPSAAYSVGSQAPYLRELLPTDQGVFFAMDTPCIYPPPWPDSQAPAPLWWSDGQGRAQMVLGGYATGTLVPAGDRLFFTARDAGRRAGLWSLALAERQATEVWHFSQVQDIAAIGSERVVFFGTRSGEGPRIWFSDGTQDGSHGLEEWCASPLRELVSVGTAAYFVCDRDLAVTDGTPAGTRPVAGAPSMPTGQYHPLIAFNGRLAAFFQPVQTEPTVELWVSDRVSGPGRLASFSAVDVTRVGSPSLVVGDTLYFMVGDTLWKTDGTATGTTSLATLSAPVGYEAGARFMAALGSSIFVVMGDATLWRVDGAVAAPVPLDPTVASIRAVEATPSRLFYAARTVADPMHLTLRAVDAEAD